MKLEKYAGNPIIAPDRENPWESLVTTNPGVMYDEDIKQFIMLYRAAGDDREHRINLGLAVSDDGFIFRRQSKEPLFLTVEGGWDCGAIEDPRLIKFGEYYFITYAAITYPPGRYWEQQDMGRICPDMPPEAPVVLRKNQTRTGLAITKDFKTIYRPGSITDQTLDDRDVVIFPEKVGGKFVTLHRPMQWAGAAYGTDYPAMWIAYSDDLLEQKQMKLLAKAEYPWEDKIGGSAPPIKTEYGWFTLYHAVGSDRQYRVGMMLLDLEHPDRVTHRYPKPILEPEFDYETKGIYPGICFPCGNAVKDGRLYVYYGGADQYVGVATADFDTLVADLLHYSVKTIG